MTNTNGLTVDEKKLGFVEASDQITYAMDKCNRIIRRTDPTGVVSYRRQMHGWWGWDTKQTEKPSWKPFSGTGYPTPDQAVKNAVNEKEDVKIIPCKPKEAADGDATGAIVISPQ